MRLGVLTTSYPRYPGDPAGSFVAELARWLAATGDEVEVLAPHPARGEATPPSLEVRALRYARRPRLCYGAGVPDNLRQPGVWGQVPAFAWRLGHECHRRSVGWDALLSHWLVPCALIGALSGRGRPHLAIAHSSDVHLLARWPALAGALLLLLARGRSGIALTSEALRAPLLRAAVGPGARRLVESAPVLRMGIPSCGLEGASVGLREPRRRRLGLAEADPLLLFLGRLVPVKGIDLLLDACAGLPVELLVVGDGPERPSLERRAAALGVRARFLGEQTGEDKAGWLAAADVLVLPSRVLPDGRTESAPLVLLEAMAAGVPVLATRVGGNPDLITEGENGLLVPPGEAAPLRAALEQLLAGPGLRRRLAEAGRRTAAANSWDELGPRFRALLCSL